MVEYKNFDVWNSSNENSKVKYEIRKVPTSCYTVRSHFARVYGLTPGYIHTISINTFFFSDNISIDYDIQRKIS